MNPKIFLRILNDLKRRPEDAARDLGRTVSEIESILSGDAPLTYELIREACRVWPINERDFFTIKDDCPTGVKITRAEESKASARIMSRSGAPYYEYRDTAMSSLAPFRPEWIEELCIVEDNDPLNPKVQWNNGHFMHQFTYFIGPVNFYYIDNDGNKQVAVMSSGDSMYISPYVPHTFTTRKNNDGRLGLILALTYGDKVVGDAHHELMALGLELGPKFFLDFECRRRSFSSLLKYYQACLSIPWTKVSEESGIGHDQLNEFVSGNKIPSQDQIYKISAALGVNARDLLPNDEDNQRVILLESKKCRSWKYPAQGGDYTITELASVKHLPHSKALKIDINSNDLSETDLCFGLHQYCYNIGDTPIDLHWRCNNSSYHEKLDPNDSYYMKPFVSHSLRGQGSLLTLRIGGSIVGEAQWELSNVGAKYAQRIIEDNMQWFNPKGKV